MVQIEQGNVSRNSQQKEIQRIKVENQNRTVKFKLTLSTDYRIILLISGYIIIKFLGIEGKFFSSRTQQSHLSISSKNLTDNSYQLHEFQLIYLLGSN